MNLEALKEEYLSGRVLLFNKPLDWTSFDLVKKTRNLLRQYLDLKKIKVGHAGTLDPLATGLMILCTGRATKGILNFQNLNKEYIASIHIGHTTPSFDLETEVDHTYEVSHITKAVVMDALKHFMGDIDQIPPLFSAKYIEGKRAYDYARKGEERILKPVRIHIDELDLLDYSKSEIKLRVVCSKGTYIRALARDLGKFLDSGAYLRKLKRTQIGEYQLDNAVSIENFEKSLKNLEQIGFPYV